MILKDIEVVRSMEYLLPPGRGKTTFASKGDKFKITAVSTTVHSTTKRGIPTIDHFINIFDNGVTRMLEIDHFFIMFFENFL